MRKLTRGMFGLGLVFLGTHVILASQTMSIPWADSNSVDLETIHLSQFASHKNRFHSDVPQETLDFVLRDGENKMGKEFKIPPELKTPVAFWLRLYTEFSTKQLVVFDVNHLDLVYEVIDLRSLIDISQDQDDFDQKASRLVRTTLGNYRKAFVHLIQHPHPKRPTREENIILSKIKNIHHKHSFQEFSENLKIIRGQRDSMVSGLVTAETYLAQMETIFRQMGVPPELVRLCLVESSFDIHAYSKAGASGLWQFMLNPGRNYLLIDESKKIDERLSPLKSTVAAAKLLLWNYRYLGSWPLAIISYNHGLRNLPKLRGKRDAISFSKISYLFRNCKKTPELGWASRNYYTEFLAALYAESYRTYFYGETPALVSTHMAFKEVPAGQTALSIAMTLGIPLNQFRQINADIQDFRKPLPKGFKIAVPGQSDNLKSLLKNLRI